MATIYIVDDEERFAQMLIQALETWGHTTRYFQDGRDALHEVALTEKPLPDIILTDFMMGDLDGITFRSYLNQNSRTRNIPTIMITGSIKTVQSKVKPLGLISILEKPVDLGRLRETIDKLLSRGDA